MLPAWPPSLSFPQEVVDGDKALKDVQGQWGMTSLVISRGLMKQEKGVLDATSALEAGPCQEVLNTLKLDKNDQMANPLAHSLCRAGGYFNDLST